MQSFEYYIAKAAAKMPFKPGTIDDVIQYYRSHYYLYLETEWWHDLTHHLIYSNPEAKCYVSSKTNNLLLHHVKYDNLFQERLYKDLYILNFDVHSHVHFWLFHKVKLPIKKKFMLRRMRALKIRYCIRNKQFGLALLYVVLAVL